MENTDQNIIKEIQKGNRHVFKDVYRMYYVSLCQFASKYFNTSEEAEDIVQEAMVTIWEKRSTLSLNCIRSYLFSSVKNACLNRLKHLSVTQKYIDQTTLEIQMLELQNDNTYFDSKEIELRNKVQSLLQNLPEQRRKVLGMKYIDGFNSKEIAQLTNTSQRTVETHLYKGIKTLRKLARSAISIVATFLIYL